MIAGVLKNTPHSSPELRIPLKRVFCLDDHPVVRDHLKLLIEEDPLLTCCGEAGNSTDALRLIGELAPDIIISDVSLGNGRDGLDFVKDVTIRFPKLPVLVLSMHDESLYAERLLRAGARGYICKTESTRAILSAIHQVLDGGIRVSSGMSATMVHRFLSGALKGLGSPIDKLSDRELEIFSQIGRGRSSRQIATDLRLDPKTIETYRSRIKAKLNLRHATELHQHAMQWLQSGNFPTAKT